MIIGIGMDLVSVQRIAALLERHGGRALTRLYGTDEISRCEQSRHPGQSYAARFAAKEAFFKAVGLGWAGGMGWSEVLVATAASGEPSIELEGRAAAVAAERGVKRMHLSLTHTAELAGAYVVLED